MAKDIFKRLSEGRLQQERETIEQQRRHDNPISRWAQECIDNDAIELDRGPYGVAMRFSLGTRIATPWLYKSCASFCRRQGVRPPNQVAFGRACTKMFGPRQNVEGQKGIRGYDVPICEVWQDILDGVWKKWHLLRPGEWVIPPLGANGL